MSDLNDFCRDAEGLRVALAQILAPFTWRVDMLPRNDPASLRGGATFDYRCELRVDYPGSPFYGQGFARLVCLREDEWRARRGDRRWLNGLPERWACELMREMIRHFANPPMPTAGEVDWRPTEAAPEDFYAR